MSSAAPCGPSCGPGTKGPSRRRAATRPGGSSAGQPPPRGGLLVGDTPLPSRWVCGCPPPRPPLNFYLHLRALVSPASLRRRPGAEKEPEPLPPPPPAGGKRGEGDEHPGADSPAPRRHQSRPARRGERLARFPPSAEGRAGGTALGPGGGGGCCPSASHTRTARCALPLTHTPRTL